MAEAFAVNSDDLERMILLKEPPMSILGTFLISVVFLPVDKIFAVEVRVVDQLPLGLILGTAFMRRYESSLVFEGPGAGWFKTTPTSPRVPLLPWLERPREPDRKAHAVQKTSTRKTTGRTSSHG